MKDLGESISIAVAQLLAQARRERGLTMEELADRAEVDRTYIGLIERGERRPTIAAAASIASGLGLTLSDVLALAEHDIEQNQQASGPETALDEVELVPKLPTRKAPREFVKSSPSLVAVTGLSGDAVAQAIESAYHTFDLIDEQLIEKGSDPLAKLVELNNLSSMLGNLVATGLADASDGIYTRNGPHMYPDLIANSNDVPNLEVKTALEKYRPKGHLPKAGAYITFRYVLCNRAGSFTRGMEYRGEVATVWEVRFGILSATDFSVSNTEGDSGKTAYIKLSAFDSMEIVYFNPDTCPYARMPKIHNQ